MAASQGERLVVPLCDTHGFFVDDSGQIADTPNQLAGPHSRIDESAVFSVLQFGAIAPPLSPWKGIRRLLPGHVYCAAEDVGPVELPRYLGAERLDAQQQSEEVERLLDRALTSLIGDAQDPVLLFSGGVDSGLLASRLVALGYRDSLLLNYSFGTDDPESRLAEAMAAHLGLRFERVSVKRGLCDSLVDPGQVYPQPFSDTSTVPTSNLAHAVIERCADRPRVIIDGTGADGALGMASWIGMWQRILRVPVPVRRAASAALDMLPPGRAGMTDRVAGALRRSVAMPPLSAVVALNSLAGTLYLDSARDVIDGFLEDWVLSFAGDDLARRIVTADLMLICANSFAQKAQAIFESAGHTVVYPFMQSEVVATALASVGHWQMDEPKAPLKRSLARHVPREMVYRPKSAFDDPSASVFSEPEFVDYLRAAAEPSGPISSLLKTKAVVEACELLSRREIPSSPALAALWAIAFTDRWYRTVR